MSSRSRWINRILLAVIWIAVTAGVAFLVARNASPESDATDVTENVLPVAANQRTTVALSEHTIAPVVSGDGRVVQDGNDWVLEAPATAAEVTYRLLDPPIGVKALINGGPVGFDCAWDGLGLSADGNVTMRCKIPSEVRVAAGLTGTMVLQLSKPQSARALPVTAVVGSADQGQVIVVNADGTSSVRVVQLGVSDSFWIEITGGIDASESVLEFPTQRDFAQASA